MGGAFSQRSFLAKTCGLGAPETRQPNGPVATGPGVCGVSPGDAALPSSSLADTLATSLSSRMRPFKRSMVLSIRLQDRSRTETFKLLRSSFNFQSIV